VKFTKFVPWLKVLSVLSLMCCLALNATAVNYYPSQVGNTWVFSSADGGEQLTYALEAPENINVEGLIELKITSAAIGTDVTVTDTYFITVENDGGLLLHQSATDQGAFGIAEVTYDPPVVFFPAELPLGQTWQILSETELKLAGAVTSTSTIKVVAIEDVETPAGVFKDCVKLEIKQRDVTVLGVLRQTSYQWLAPDVGPVKFLSDQDIVYELHNYNLIVPTETEETPPTEEAPIVEETPPAETTTEKPMAAESTFAFDLTLKPGLNMISIPLMPEEPYTAKSLAERVGATTVIQLNMTTQNFIAYTVAESGDGFGIDGGKGYIVNTPTGDTITFTGTAWDNQPELEYLAGQGDIVVMDTGDPSGHRPQEPQPAEDEPDADEAPAAPILSTFKSAWAFVITSDIRGMKTDTAYTLVAENLRTRAVARAYITPDVRRSSAVWADLNRKSVVEVGDKLEVALYDEGGQMVSGPVQRTVSTTDIRNAFLSLQLNIGDERPQETVLAQNFPNPFNPETWIPYQLSESTKVWIQIYEGSGRLVRSLNLGWQPVGSYMTPSRAAYWDGQNEIGEPVSSGVYFYTLTAGDFTATRKMLILK